MDDVALKRAMDAAQKATYFDQARRYEEAVFCYSEAANRLLQLVQAKKCIPIFRKNVREYVERAEFLKKNMKDLQEKYSKPEEVQIFEKAEFMFLKAEFLDEGTHFELASDAYKEVLEYAINVGKSNLADVGIKTKIREMVVNGLKRVEELDATIRSKRVDELAQMLPEAPNIALPIASSDVGDHADNVQMPSATGASSHPTSGNTEKFSKEELVVLAATSNINGRIYVPFLDQDLAENFKLPAKFSDGDGKIKLADKQMKRLKAWKRVSDIFDDPVVIKNIESSTIKQTLVSDCSFISSLSIAASYESRFGKQLVTSCIFPQNKNGQPVFNPSGKYMAKFHINGVWRKVIIDDYLPCDEAGNLLCSHSERKGELWVSLLEKAYLKVMGGYDFPGSNSNIDMNALTGWIPERISILKGNPEFQADKVFEKLFSRMHRGDCLVTLATGKLPKEQCDRAGLVETHAYAVLDFRRLGDKRLLKVKNPWTHLRWKGRYSEKDTASWTPEMRHALSYDPEKAAEKDDGVFWIDYESVLHFFDVFYVNWNPALFAFTSVVHASWDACTGPVKDLYTVGDNPQYVLTVNNTAASAAVWILLTRHITSIDDFAVNNEYITVVVYDTGKKVYIPSDPPPIHDGARINSPHYLCQLVATKPGLNAYTLVIAQYEKSTTIKYTLRAYSSVNCSLKPILSPYKITKTVSGSWDEKTAGGCGNGTSRTTVGNNPIYEVSLTSASDDNFLFVELKAPKQYSVAFDVKQKSSTRTVFFESKHSGAFRPGYTVLETANVPAGVLHVRPMTFVAGEKGPFIIKFEASCGLDVKRIQ